MENLRKLSLNAPEINEVTDAYEDKVEEWIFVGESSISKEDIKRVYSETIFERGLDYFVEGRVTDVIKFKNKLTGEVKGSAKYKTEVDLSDLHSRCSCPYGINCKHGAAMLLQYLLEDIPMGMKPLKVWME